jgi:hypothetical protein
VFLRELCTLALVDTCHDVIVPVSFALTGYKLPVHNKYASRLLLCLIVATANFQHVTIDKFAYHRPQVRQLTSIGRLSEAKAEHSSGAFFLYVGPLVDEEKLYVCISS